MDLDIVRRTTELTGVGQQSFHDLTSSTPDRFRWGVVTLCPTIPAQGNSAKTRHEWGFGRSSIHPDFQDLVGPVLRAVLSAETSIDLRSTGFEFHRQRARERRFHHPFQSLELVEVVGHLVILDHAPVFRLVLGHYAIGTVTGPCLLYTSPSPRD